MQLKIKLKNAQTWK